VNRLPTPHGEFTAGRENRHRRPKGYAAWRPQANTRHLLEQVNAVLDEYAEHLPLTVRQIYYRLVGGYGYEKTEQAYKRLGEHLVRARRAKLIAFDAVRDDTVLSYSSPWHEGVEDFWNETGRRIRNYQRDRQTGQRVRVELWCEAAGMAPQLARVADAYSVPVYATGGFGSLTAVRQIADRALARTMPTVLLHVGDYDPSGESIFAAVAEDAAAFVEADRIVNTLRIRPVRVALTAAQVELYQLPTAPPKPSDSRSRHWDGGTCQLEALAPDLLAQLVREAIAHELNLDSLAAQIVREDDDRLELWRGLPPARGAAS
jgi:hypothetical protein